MCPTCYYAIPSGPVPTPTPMAMPVPPVQAYPARPPGMFGPLFQPLGFRRWRVMPVILLFTAAALIFANGVALLSPGFFLFWGAFIPWLWFLGSFAFILGIMLGLILIGALILTFLGLRAMAAFVIFPTAIVSFFIGGGFLLGAILAVIAGILLIL